MSHTDDEERGPAYYARMDAEQRLLDLTDLQEALEEGRRLTREQRELRDEVAASGLDLEVAIDFERAMAKDD